VRASHRDEKETPERENPSQAITWTERRITAIVSGCCG